MQPNPLVPSNRLSPRAGAISRGCLVGLGLGAALLILALIGGGAGVSKFNQLKSRRQNVERAWAEIDNQYKRRYDLVPNLVATVKGAADFEKSTVEAVTEARAS